MPKFKVVQSDCSHPKASPCLSIIFAIIVVFQWKSGPMLESQLSPSQTLQHAKKRKRERERSSRFFFIKSQHSHSFPASILCSGSMLANHSDVLLLDVYPLFIIYSWRGSVLVFFWSMYVRSLSRRSILKTTQSKWFADRESMFWEKARKKRPNDGFAGDFRMVGTRFSMIITEIAYNSQLALYIMQDLVTIVLLLELAIGSSRVF